MKSILLTVAVFAVFFASIGSAAETTRLEAGWRAARP